MDMRGDLKCWGELFDEMGSCDEGVSFHYLKSSIFPNVDFFFIFSIPYPGPPQLLTDSRYSNNRRISIQSLRTSSTEEEGERT